MGISIRSGSPTSVDPNFKGAGPGILRPEDTGRTTAPVPKLAYQIESRHASDYFQRRFGEPAGGSQASELAHPDAQAADPPFKGQVTARAWNPGGWLDRPASAISPMPPRHFLERFAPCVPELCHVEALACASTSLDVAPARYVTTITLGEMRNEVELVLHLGVQRGKQESVSSTSFSETSRSRVRFADEIGLPLAEIHCAEAATYRSEITVQIRPGMTPLPTEAASGSSGGFVKYRLEVERGDETAFREDTEAMEDRSQGWKRPAGTALVEMLEPRSRQFNSVGTQINTVTSDSLDELNAHEFPRAKQTTRSPVEDSAFQRSDPLRSTHRVASRSPVSTSHRAADPSQTVDDAPRNGEAGRQAKVKEARVHPLRRALGVFKWLGTMASLLGRRVVESSDSKAPRTDIRMTSFKIREDE
jgi:hypothetical protein